jgi:hypothetical protein
VANQQNVGVVNPQPLPVNAPPVAQNDQQPAQHVPKQGSILAAMQSKPKAAKKEEASNDLSFEDIQNKFGGSVVKRNKDAVAKKGPAPLNPSPLGKSKGMGSGGGGGGVG